MKTIPNTDNCYAATEDGRIFSLRQGTQLSPVISNRGYLQVTLRVTGKILNRRVHRLIAQTFLDNPDDLSQINHIDGNKLNNHVDNLEWCTSEYNIERSFADGSHAWPMREVIGVDEQTGTTYWFRSTREAKRHRLKFDPSKIINCCKGKRPTHRGLRWYYYDELPETA